MQQSLLVTDTRAEEAKNIPGANYVCWSLLFPFAGTQTVNSD